MPRFTEAVMHPHTYIYIHAESGMMFFIMFNAEGHIPTSIDILIRGLREPEADDRLLIKLIGVENATLLPIDPAVHVVQALQARSSSCVDHLASSEELVHILVHDVGLLVLVQRQHEQLIVEGSVGLLERAHAARREDIGVHRAQRLLLDGQGHRLKLPTARWHRLPVRCGTERLYQALLQELGRLDGFVSVRLQVADDIGLRFLDLSFGLPLHVRGHALRDGRRDPKARASTRRHC